ncbi:cupin domain-containing protein [Niabella sp. CJ426]|uniref:cupin domain-containing protein n=1 Tax=Niabella sp. CJ426 TaxID=3393740 RepID=UPI003CFCB88E
MYIVSGEFIVHIEGKDIPVTTGDTVFIPKRPLHTITNPIENNPGTVMVVVQPAPQNEQRV